MAARFLRIADVRSEVAEQEDVAPYTKYLLGTREAHEGDDDGRVLCDEDNHPRALCHTFLCDTENENMALRVESSTIRQDGRHERTTWRD